MDVVSGSAAKGPGTLLRRVAEPVGFALASLGIQLLPSAFWSLPIFGESPDMIILSFGMGLVMFAGLTCLAFAAGWRRSWIDLLAVFVGWVLGLTYNYLPMLLGPRT